MDEEKGDSGTSLEDEDIFEVLKRKGDHPSLNAFRHEFVELQKTYDGAVANVVSRERELEAANHELFVVRDQINFTNRSIEDLNSAKEALEDGIEHKKFVKAGLEDRESSNRSEIRSFTNFFEDLKEQLSVGADWSPEQLEQKQALEKERDFLTSKLENRIAQVNGVISDCDRTEDRIHQLHAEIDELERKSNEIEKRTAEYMKESQVLTDKRRKLERHIQDLRSEELQLEADFNEKRRATKSNERSYGDLQESLEQCKGQMEAYLVEYNRLVRLMEQTSSELERTKTLCKKADAEIDERREQIAEREKDIVRDGKEIKKTTALCDLASAKCDEVDEEKRVAEAKRDALSEKILGIHTVDLVAIRRILESQDKQHASLKSELEIVRKKNTSSEKASRQMADLIMMNQNGVRNLLQERKLLEDDVEFSKKDTRLLLAEKERYEHETEMVSQQYYTALEELKLQELQINELQKKIIEDQAKLKHKQTLYEAVRSDRNLYSRQLGDSQDEIQGLRRNFRGMNHQIEQLKEEISVKDHAIVKEHFLHHSVDKEREMLKNELTKIRKQLKSSDGIVDNQHVELLKLNRIIDEADNERRRQRNELTSVIAERNLLIGQVVKRNYELGVMYDRIKLQRSNLRIGERNYATVMEGLAQWRRQLVELVGDQNQTITALSGVDELRYKVVQLERELLSMQSKNRALMDELVNPMNVHRWRILESSDPKRFEKILSIQSLQKQLVGKADEVTEADLMIQEKEKIYLELKKIITRQPGPEVEEQLLVYQQTLKDKCKQLVSMEEELGMYRQQVKSFKEDLVAIDSNMSRLKKKYFKQRKALESA